MSGFTAQSTETTISVPVDQAEPDDESTISNSTTSSPDDSCSLVPDVNVPQLDGGVNADDAPAHYSSDWCHVELIPATEDRPRRPWIALPENLVDPTPQQRALAEMVWGGVQYQWSELKGAIEERGRDVGLLVARSGLVVLDLDVKTYGVENPARGADGGVCFGDTVETKYGVVDLQREVEKLGHAMAELATYTVRTKSGGLHLYYQANPRFPLRTAHHMHEWRIDVIASPNNWVAAPPTPGYHVVRDLPVAPLPDWLAEFLGNLRRHLLPLGGTAGQRLRHEVYQARSEALVAMMDESTGDGTFGGLMRTFVSGVCALVRKSNEWGGWNQSIYDNAHILFDCGYRHDQVTRWLLAAAAPRTESDRRQAEGTINSAHQRNVNTRGGAL